MHRSIAVGRYGRVGSRLFDQRSMSSLPRLEDFATFDPEDTSKPCDLENLVDGKWTGTAKYADIPDPLDKSRIVARMPDTSVEEASAFVSSLAKVPKCGLHNPLLRPERYVQYGELCHKVAASLAQPEVEDFFTKCVQRVMPKSRPQALGEVVVSRTFLENFAGDGVRFMAKGFTVSGDHAGQESRGYRWPYGPVAIVCPFNFPLEIPVLQLMGALFMGNKPMIKGAPQTSLVLEQYVRLLIACGMSPEDLDLLHGYGACTEKVILETPVRVTQFTGSSGVAERLCEKTRGKVKIEDAGFDWKVIGPDIGPKEVDYVAWQSDQDAYAMGGQKCSAQSIVFVHKNAIEAGYLDKVKSLAERRSLEDLTISPVLSLTTEYMLEHAHKVAELPGAKILFGAKALENHQVPDHIGAIEPTAVSVPIAELLKSDKSFELCTTEIFGPFQIVCEYDDSQVDMIIDACERMSHHLTAGIVSNDVKFTHKILSQTVNGTTYHGQRARTTGAPANHWFGPAGDPRGAGIGSPEAIRLVWSCHREIVQDNMIPEDWTLPSKPT